VCVGSRPGPAWASWGGRVDGRGRKRAGNDVSRCVASFVVVVVVACDVGGGGGDA